MARVLRSVVAVVSLPAAASFPVAAVVSSMPHRFGG